MFSVAEQRPSNKAMNRSTLAYSFSNVMRFGNIVWLFNA